MSHSTDLPMGSGCGPPPGPAFGTSSVPPPVSEAGPAAASERTSSEDHTEQSEHTHSP